jgi:hypothetical protein
LKIALSVRPVQALGIAEGMVPDGTRSVSVFLVNHCTPLETDENRDERFIFQSRLEVHADKPLIPRPNLKGQATEEWDERVADLQYRDVYEYAVGHGISTHAETDDQGFCRTVRTCWIPGAKVERVAPAQIPNVELRMESLAGLAEGTAAQQVLGAFVQQYRARIKKQEEVYPTLSTKRREIAAALLLRAGTAATRIEDGIQALSDPTALKGELVSIHFSCHAMDRRGSLGGMGRLPRPIGDGLVYHTP